MESLHANGELPILTLPPEACSYLPGRTSQMEYRFRHGVAAAEFAHEMLFFREGKLLGVGLVDLLPASSSSVYFFHDPSWRPASPGTYSLLMEIEAARQSGRGHHYLGYWVAGNQSMQYKANFRPHELLAGHVGDGETPSWFSQDYPW